MRSIKIKQEQQQETDKALKTLYSRCKTEIEEHLVVLALKNGKNRAEILKIVKSPQELKKLGKTSDELQDFFEKCPKDNLELYVPKFELFSV